MVCQTSIDAMDALGINEAALVTVLTDLTSSEYAEFLLYIYINQANNMTLTVLHQGC